MNVFLNDVSLLLSCCRWRFRCELFITNMPAQVTQWSIERERERERNSFHFLPLSRIRNGIQLFAERKLEFFPLSLTHSLSVRYTTWVQGAPHSYTAQSILFSFASIVASRLCYCHRLVVFAIWSSLFRTIFLLYFHSARIYVWHIFLFVRIFSDMHLGLPSNHFYVCFVHTKILFPFRFALIRYTLLFQRFFSVRQ